ncbi:MAG TPA: ATP-binding protein, partial [Candidatus Limiplasma sp.]|nr:ATP-binding protein [Candidatus Limiplasma sp.]
LISVSDGRKKVISVGLYPKMRWTLLDINDNGCGIPEANLTNIFSPLFSTKPMTKSWGIGLSLTHRIITSMGGRIEVESGVGKGTTFHILLPSVK